MLLADSGYDGVANHPTAHVTNRTAESVITPYKARRNHPKIPLQRVANTALARARGPGERGFATLKNRHILHRVRSCPHCVGTLAQAVLTLEHNTNP